MKESMGIFLFMAEQGLNQWQKSAYVTSSLIG